ncbi:P-loop containing nucleoside triphosphate hydrolase protein [Naematelia encephala]|uniref:p-loop containing nucleoside triphosphate hydrolase protein n=1 Tax=Naematelia encephala TaxID=71784 RepID=A0A1Y2APX5_9TREE|nr:P-loop containing nucleoside triphosphate hydrolase protein [Naematelia encephala]
MPAPSKRTRTTGNDENESSSSSRNLGHTRRPSGTPSNTSTTPTTPSRPILTRSATTQSSPPSHITRSASLFITPTRRPGPSSLGPPSATIGGSSGRVGTLSRTQSQPAMPSPEDLKAGAVAGGSGNRGKDDGPDEFGMMRGARRFGRGKENIPPKKDAQLAESSRKRMRVGSQSSATGRRRSGSVSSMRSDTGRHTSLCPTSSSSSFSFRSRMSSPSPSQATSQSFDSITSVDPLDVIARQDDTDMDQTPTRARPNSRRMQTLPTPPPSSPTIQATTQRLSLVRMHTDSTVRTSPFEEDRRVNPYKYLKSFLRLSAAPIDGSTIVGRDDEKSALKSYLEASGRDVGMYISGPPGTGKTATTTALGREMRTIGWQVAEVGCMGLKVADMWRRLGEELGCGKTEKEVQAYLEQANTQTLIILDEIDSLLPPPPASTPPATSHLLSRIFSLPLSNTSTVKLVAISNTLDLTLRANLVLPNNAQPLVLPFKAYVGADMAAIVYSRIAAASVDREDAETVKVDAKAIELLTKKVENQNGDLRMCLGVLTSGVSLAEVEWNKKGSPEGALIKVNLQHTIKAFNSHTNQLKAAAGSSVAGILSDSGRKIKSVPLQGKMVLVSMLLFMTRVGAGLSGCPGVPGATLTPPSTPTKNSSTETLNATNLYATYSYLLTQAASPFPPATESDYRDLLSNLEVLGLVSVMTSSSTGMSRTNSSGSGRGKSGAPRIEMCVREDEIKAGLGLGEAAGRGLAEEEVARVWEREEGRVKRVLEKAKMREMRAEESFEVEF